MEYKKPVIPMSAAVKALHLCVDGVGSPELDTSLPTADMLCPSCSGKHKSRRRTLHLDFDSSTFCCMRCGFKGGVYDLVSFYTGWARNEVPKRIKNGELNGIDVTTLEHGSVDSPDENTSCINRLPLAPLSRRDAVYRAFLERLELYPAHQEELLQRGLTKLDIDRIGFKSLPKFMDRSVLPKRMISAGYDLRGVPGFGLEGGSWNLTQSFDGGYLIPLRNGDGLIQGFQVRHDHPSERFSKYDYFANRKMEYTAGAMSWIAWAGKNILLDNEPFDVIVTEGALKGYIVNAKTGCNVISVPGVAALKAIPAAMETAKTHGLRTVYIAYDMDADTNEDVAKQLKNLGDKLEKAKIPHKVLRWDPRYKGIDDYVVHAGINRI